jgi:Lrp/AsnC family transcriptional regulator of lysine biosynthesis
MSYTEMADRVGMSEGTVRKRVRKLVMEGIIKRFTIETGTEKPEAMVLVTTQAGTATSTIAEGIAVLGDVVSAREVTGQFDIVVLLSGDDIASINRGVDRVRGVEGVSKTNTLFVLNKW